MNVMPDRATFSHRLIAATTSMALVTAVVPSPAVWANAPIATSVSQPASGARARGTFAYEAYQTDLFTGAATLSIPLEVPPGRRGIQPNLVVGYASGSGNDWVGVGWNLSLGFIQRDTTKGVPTYTTSDPFVFSLNGANDQLVAVGTGEYRAEVEEAFLRFQFDGVSWRVTDKAGIQYRFGSTSASRQTIPGKGVFRWALDRIEDLHGNYLTVSYTADQNQLYPLQVAYTGNTLAGDLPRMTVEFWLEDRADPIVSYRAGGLVETRKRLKQVETKVDGALAKRYLLGYSESQDTFRSLLSSITIFGSDGVTSLPPVRVAYYQSPGTWARDDRWNIPDGAFTVNNEDQGRRLADVNGDGLTDLLVAKNSGASWYLAAYKNTGSGWVQDNGWNLNDGNFVYADRDDGRWFAELNGDGFIDILIGNDWGGGSYKSAMVNRGSGWTRDVHTWDIPDGFLIVGGRDGGRRLPDLNGDGLSDLLYAKDGQRSSYVNTGSGWRAEPGWTSPVDHVAQNVDTGARSVDLNGDGLTDLIYAKDGDKRAYLNTGGGWVQDARWNLPDGNLMASNQDQGRRFADLNGDGLSDLLIAKDGYRATYVNTGSGWRQVSKWTIPDGDFVSGGNDQGRWITDLNGDGLVDVPIAKDSYKATYTNPFPPSDLLLQFDNGVGGTTAITYVASTRFYNSGPLGVPNLPFPVITVAEVTRQDGLGHQYTTRHDYADGLYDWQAREFRGFNRARALDADGNYSDTWFKQDNVFKGKPYLIEVRDAAGNLYRQTFHTWQSRQPFPGVLFAFLATTDQYTCDGDTTCRLTQTDFTYDDYGNVIETLLWGEVDPNNRNTLSGDEQRVQTEFTHNLSAWILDKPSHQVVYDANWNRLSDTWFYYDNHSTFTEAPTNGLLTKEERWLNTGPSNAATTFGYDLYGNLTSGTNPRGFTTTTAYDPAYRTFPVTVANALGHTLQATHDPKNGQPLSQTDANGQTTTLQYDALGRLIKIIGPNDTSALPTINYSYDLTTIPVRTVTEARIQSNQTPVLTTYVFVDGLGRTIQTRVPAEDSTKQVVNGALEFNSRGLVTRQWVPYLANTSASYVPLNEEPIAATLASTSFAYDPLGRLARTVEPNGAAADTRYSDWTMTTLDANGHQVAQTSDAHGRLLKVEEFTGSDGRNPAYPASPYQLYATTSYQYDGLNRLVTVTDARGNVTQLTYDSLGRKTAMVDPDMGRWTYQYDAAGNLVAQTDARGVGISFTYDPLNRLTQKSYTIPVGSEIPSPGTVSYSYDDPVKPWSKGKLTAITDGSGSSSFEYDSLGRLMRESKTVDGTTYTIQRAYDLLGRLTALTYPDTEVVSYTYNLQGGIESITGLKSGVTTTYLSGMTYNATGQATQIRYGNGTVTDYTYNPQTLRADQLRSTGPGGLLQDFAYSFDLVGNVMGITDAAHTATQGFGYDALNRLTSASGSYGDVTYAYDPIGNMTSKEGVTMSYGLADATKPHAVTWTSSGLDLAYDANGNLVSKVERLTGDSLALVTYDAENRVVEVLANPSNVQTKTVNLQPGWNFFAVPLAVSNLSIASVFGSQLTAITQVSRLDPPTGQWEHFVNDPALNQFDTLEVGRGYAVYANAAVTLTLTGTPQTGSTTLPAGKHLLGNTRGQTLTLAQLLNNLIPGVDVIASWRFDGTNFIALSPTDLIVPGEAIVVQVPAPKVWTFSASGSVQTLTSFVYDGDGGRVKVTTNALSGFGTTIYVGSLYETRNGAPLKHLYRGTDLVATVTGGQVLFRHDDHLGSTNVVTDPAGTQGQLLEYSPYGSVVRKEGTVDLAHKFTGHRHDAAGLVFMGARSYDPSLGRFLSADPAQPRWADPQDLNRYSYARNNPLKYIDPLGYGWFSKFFKKLGKALLSAVLAIATIFLSAIPGGQLPAVWTAKAMFFTAASAAAATLALDTGEGRQIQGRLAREVFDDAFGMRPRAAAFTAGMVSHTLVSSAFYIGLTTLSPNPSPGTDFSDPANQGQIARHKIEGAHQPGGSTANFVADRVERGLTATGKAASLPQGIMASDIAFNDTPIVGTLFKWINARHAAFTTQINGRFFDSAEMVLMRPLRGAIYGSPWTGISHQAFFNTMIGGGFSGVQALGYATSQVNWSFYLSSSLYGVNSGYGVSGIYTGLVSAERK